MHRSITIEEQLGETFRSVQRNTRQDCVNRLSSLVRVRMMAFATSSEALSPRLEKPMKILVVEDHAPTRMAISRLMRQAGAEVITARDGEEALGYLVTQRFEVLLTDLRMPVMDGFELLQHVMKLPPSHRPGRVIAISGEYEATALRGQPVAFLPKPFDLNALLEMLGGKLN